MVENPLFDYIAYLNDERDSTTVPPAELQAVRENPQMAPELVEYPVLSTNWLALNGARGPLANPQVRKAISKAIDRERLVRDINAGLGRPATSVVPPGMPGHQPGLGSDIDLDVAGARDLLAQAGFPGGAGFPRLSFSYAAGGLQRRAEFIQAQLKDNLGVDIQLNPVEQKAFAALFTEQRYDISLIAWSADYPDPQNWFNGNFGCRTLNNKYSYCNPVFDDLVARADSSVDPDDRLALYSQAQELLIADLPVVPLDHAGGLVLVKPYVRNMVVTALDAYAGDRFLDRVTIDAH
jgi:oligopeptide transport system substrate-binding protein